MNHLGFLAFQALCCCDMLMMRCSPTITLPEEEDDFSKTSVDVGGRSVVNMTDPRTTQRSIYEENATDCRGTQNSIYITCERMRRLDQLLTKMYGDPPENGGDELMRLSGIYNQACRDLLHLCTVDRSKALHAARDMMEFGGPKFLEVDVDEKKMQERFKWSKDLVELIYVERGRTHELFSDLWQFYETLPE